MPLIQPTEASTAVPSPTGPGQSPQDAAVLQGLSEALPGGAAGVHVPLRTTRGQGPRQVLGVGPGTTLCASLLSCPPDLERLEPLKYTKLGGPKSWKLRKPPVLRAPTISGGLCGADPH